MDKQYASFTQSWKKHNSSHPYGITINPNPHGMFWAKGIYDLASSEPYSLSSLNSKNLKKYVNVRKGLGNTLKFNKFFVE